MDLETKAKTTDDWRVNFAKGMNALIEKDLDIAIDELTKGAELASSQNNRERHIYCLLGLARAFCSAERLKEAEDAAWKAIHYCHMLPKRDAVLHAMCIATQGMLHFKQDKLDEATPMLENAFTVLRTHKPGPVFLDYYEALLECHLERGKFVKAERVGEAIWNVSQTIFGVNDPNTIAALYIWADCLEALGKRKKADRLRVKAGAILQEHGEEPLDISNLSSLALGALMSA